MASTATSPREISKDAPVIDFDAIRLAIASPDQILSWSHGEVTKAETINYRTQKPEKEGLFDERIFGPSKDWECYCGKYKRIRYKDVVCDKCGVRVTRSIVRRERMGHITLAVPVAHVWFLRGAPSTIGTVLNLAVKELERVVYFASYIVQSVDEDRRVKALDKLAKEHQKEVEKLMNAQASPEEIAAAGQLYQTLKSDLESLHPMQIISDLKYQELEELFGEVFKAGIGAEALQSILASIDMEKLIAQLGEEAANSQGQKRKKALKRLKLIEGMHYAKLRPEWSVISHLPVIPPDLRPMVQLTGGRFAASDLNDLYRRVINRNNRLKRLIELDAPEVIQRNEKRMLQEAVDALVDNNARRERAVSSTGGRHKLRSLSDMLKGKQGRFRQNLLGKRVDYSGRSVIVAGPYLHLDQCGIPKMMALELFKPFVMGQLIEAGYAHNIRSAGRMIERGTTEVWDTLEEIIADKHVLLNRAPTLHRLGIQAFKPTLIEGKAIQLHPLVCYAFNADFDGDQMAVHVPLSQPAQKEAREIMLSSKNLLKPADGSVVVNPSKDIVLGIYFLTFAEEAEAPKAFSSVSEAEFAFDAGKIKLQTPIELELDGEKIETTLGRVIFNEILPADFSFQNDVLVKKTLQKLVAKVFDQFGTEITAKVVDDIKDLGFRYATLSGWSIGMDDFISPDAKQGILDESERSVLNISQQYESGLISEEERYERTINVWKKTTEQVMTLIEDGMKENSTPMTIFVETGAGGDLAQVNQIAGMLGLVVDPSQRTIELPIKSNYKEGFSVLEYFNSTHGARKGLTDTALKTAESGYLTRRLVDVAQDVFITEEDCKDKNGRVLNKNEIEGEDFAFRLIGRVLAAPVKDASGTVIGKAGELIGDELAAKITESSIEEVRIRNVLNCQTLWGICRKCYGLDLARGQLVALGEPVGVIAAQSIGEPGTQLTMKIFHKGGVAGEDITQGLPRVEEIFEARNPRGQAILSETDGVVTTYTHDGKQVIRVTPADVKIVEYDLTDKVATVKTGDEVKPGDVIATNADGKKAVKVKLGGTVDVGKSVIKLLATGENLREYMISAQQNIEVEDGDLVTAGQRLTEGSVNLQEMLHLLGEKSVERYIITSVKGIYASQGQPISDKHIEVIIHQMFSKVQIDEPGDSSFVTGDVVGRAVVEEENRRLKSEGKKLAACEQLLLGITKVSTSADSFLSAASFQETTRVLINAAVRGKIDRLRGLKENVIIGRLIPVGTGFRQLTSPEETA